MGAALLVNTALVKGGGGCIFHYNKYRWHGGRKKRKIKKKKKWLPGNCFTAVPISGVVREKLRHKYFHTLSVVSLERKQKENT